VRVRHDAGEELGDGGGGDPVQQDALLLLRGGEDPLPLLQSLRAVRPSRLGGS